MIRLLIFFTLATTSLGQLLFHGPRSNYLPIASRAVIENSLRESQLPEELLNKFYKDPSIAEALAKESWFTSKEMAVLGREAEKIPREQILKIFLDAGFINKNRRK